MAADGVAVPNGISLQTAWLKSFLAVADTGGFGAATLPLHLSQSRVSAHVAALENAIGVVLIDRKSRPTSTTEAGELFREHALAALRELQRGAEAARSTLDNLVVHATIGSYPSASSTYLPAVLKELQARYPGITVELLEGNAANLEEMVANGTVDLAFRPLQPRMQDSELCHRTIWREEIVAVMREDDDLASSNSVSVGDLLSRRLIGNPSGSERSGGGFDLRNTLGTAAEGRIVLLTDQPSTMAALVRETFGIGVISRLALETIGMQGLVVRRIESSAAYRDIAVFWLRRRTDRAVVRALLEAQAAAALPSGVLPAP